jgi:glycosyltransferase involved in cell wall biosynthesis
MDTPKITFGMIVLNGEPYIKYAIRSLYEHAHEIIVVEGACPGASNVATNNGHSTDTTLETLHYLQINEDPFKKIHVVTAETEGHPSGFWPGEKLEQSQAYANRATGNYLWQIDSDEFYKEKDIKTVKNMLKKDSSITAVSFKQLQFWGGFDYLVNSWFLRRGAEEFHRLFKWGDGYEYIRHRSPTILDAKGADTKKQNWIRGKKMTQMNIHLYHYSFVFPKQVFEKASYYHYADWSNRTKSDWWVNNVYLKLEDPFSVFSIYDDVSWLERFKGSHPKQILEMIRDIENGNLLIKTRDTCDIEKLLSSPKYRAQVFFLKVVIQLYIYLRKVKNKAMKLLAINTSSK